jgi:hypothetical protein
MARRHLPQQSRVIGNLRNSLTAGGIIPQDPAHQLQSCSAPMPSSDLDGRSSSGARQEPTSLTARPIAPFVAPARTMLRIPVLAPVGTQSTQADGMRGINEI